jgi:hypothetical protein
VVGAEDIYFRPPPERRLHCDLDEMGGRSRRLSGSSKRVGAGDVEVTQDDVVQSMRDPASRNMISLISLEDLRSIPQIF